MDWQSWLGPALLSRSQIIETAYAVKEAGAIFLRVARSKPVLSPYSFPGYGQRDCALHEGNGQRIDRL